MVFSFSDTVLTLSVINLSIWHPGVLVRYPILYHVICFYYVFSSIMGSNFSLSFYWPVLFYPSKFPSCHILFHTSTFLNSLIYFYLWYIYNTFILDLLMTEYCHIGSTLQLAECEKELQRVVNEYPLSM